MNSGTASPKPQDWKALNLVADHVDLILGDDNIPNHFRLLGEDGGTFEEWDRHEVLMVLPDVASLGKDRDERLRALESRLKSFAAYKWLSNQYGWKKADDILARRAIRQEKYRVPTAKFLLLQSVVPELASYFYQIDNDLAPRYPTKDEFRKAYDAAKRVGDFLENPAMLLALSFRGQQFIEFKYLVIKMREMKDHYRKPPLDETFRERVYLGNLVRALHRRFGECHIALVRNLASLANGYSPAEKELKSQVSVALSIGGREKFVINGRDL